MISLAVVDLIMKIDSKFYLKEILCVGDLKKWFKDNNIDGLIGQKIDHVLGTPISLNGGIVEIQNIF